MTGGCNRDEVKIQAEQMQYPENVLKQFGGLPMNEIIGNFNLLSSCWKTSFEIYNLIRN